MAQATEPSTTLGGREKKVFRVYVPMILEVDAEHLKSVMSEEWAKDFYRFGSEAEFATYVARLIVDGVVTGSLTRFDGHADAPVDVAQIRLADLDDPEWATATDYTEAVEA